MTQTFRKRFMGLLHMGLFAFLLFVPSLVAVQAEEEETPNKLIGSFLKSINTTANKSGYQTGTGNTLADVISNVTTAFIGFLGVISTLLIIYAGYLWMTAGGDDSKIEKAKSIIKQVIVGFVVLSLAYGIIAYVFYAITIAGKGEV